MLQERVIAFWFEDLPVFERINNLLSSIIWKKSIKIYRYGHCIQFLVIKTSHVKSLEILAQLLLHFQTKSKTWLRIIEQWLIQILTIHKLSIECNVAWNVSLAHAYEVWVFESTDWRIVKACWRLHHLESLILLFEQWTAILNWWIIGRVIIVIDAFWYFVKALWRLVKWWHQVHWPRLTFFFEYSLNLLRNCFSCCCILSWKWAVIYFFQWVLWIEIFIWSWRL